MRTYKLNDIFESMQEEIERMFADEFNTFEPAFIPNRRQLEYNPKHELTKTNNNTFRRPITGISETESEYIATIELPGVDKKDININIEKQTVEIKVEKQTEKEKKNDDNKIISYSRQYAGFYRCFNLPENSNVDSISADYKNGILTLSIPKKEIKTKKEIKRIEVK